VHAGAEKAGQELGVNIIWKGPLREDDREDQIKVVENFINMRVKGIVLAPLDDTALVPVVTDAIRAGIPVIAFDSSIKTDQIASFVATDNYRGGKLAGDHLAQLLGGKGKVIMLRYAEGSASTAERERGFLDAIAAHKEIEVVSSNQYGGVTTESAFKVSENLLTSHKGPNGLTVQGIFCPNESTAFGMLRALEDDGFAGKVAFVGFDSSPKLVDAMAKGNLNATVVQDPIKMGYLAVKAIILRASRSTSASTPAPR
jgi:ribose transport system substrate-binding protein